MMEIYAKNKFEGFKIFLLSVFKREDNRKERI